MATATEKLARAKLTAGVELDTSYTVIRTPAAMPEHKADFLDPEGNTIETPKFWIHRLEFADGMAVTKDRKLAVRIAREFPDYKLEPALTEEEFGPRAEPDEDEEED